MLKGQLTSVETPTCPAVRTSPPAPHGLPCQDRRRPRTASLHPRPYRPPDFRPACHRRRTELPARTPRPPQRHPCLVETQPDLTAETAGRSGIPRGPPITSGFKPSETTVSDLVRDNSSDRTRPPPPNGRGLSQEHRPVTWSRQRLHKAVPDGADRQDGAKNRGGPCAVIVADGSTCGGGRHRRGDRSERGPAF